MRLPSACRRRGGLLVSVLALALQVTTPARGDEKAARGSSRSRSEELLSILERHGIVEIRRGVAPDLQGAAEELGATLPPDTVAAIFERHGVAGPSRTAAPDIAGALAELGVLTGTIDGKEEQKQKSGTETFRGLDFNVALAVSFFFGDDKIVEEAAVDNGVVTVRKEKTIVTNVLLESHYFFLWGENQWGAGPFVGILSSTDDVIDAYSIGAMLGRRRSDEGRSFNVGVGLFLNPEVQKLGTGFSEGEAAPGGATEVTYRKESALGLTVLASFGF